MPVRRQTTSFNRAVLCLASSVAGLSAVVPAAAQSSGISDLGVLNSGTASRAVAISADGTVAAGYADDGAIANEIRAFRWTAASGAMTSLGTLNGGQFSIGTGLSADGSVVVGYADDGAAGNALRAFRWTAASNTMTSLGGLRGGTTSVATGVSGNGLVVVGYAGDGAEAGVQRAFRWTTASNTMTSLGTLNGGATSTAQSTNFDGSVVVGYADDGTAGGLQRAFRWTAAGNTMTSLGTLNGGTTSAAQSVTPDGMIVVGYSADGAAGDALRAVRWTVASNTMTNLGTLNGGLMSAATGVSADGAVVVGYANDGAAGNVNRAFRWTQATGLISVDQWLRNNGVSLPSDVTDSAYATSADGNVIAGRLANNHAFIARGPVAGVATAGLMDVANFYTSLATLPGLGPQLQMADLTMNGAHSSPLYTLLAPGQSSVWTTGDLAISNSALFNSSLGLGELGIAHGIAPGITLRAAMGAQYSRQNLAFGGEGKLSTTYIVPEVTWSLGSNLYLSGAGYLSWGDATLRRAYANGAATDFSSGQAYTQTDGFRARFDWKDAAKVAATTLSPYASFSRFTARLDGYTETGGSFPVRINAMRETASIARIGGDTLTPITSSVGLIGRLEYAHRFEQTGASINGQILGLSAFDFAGPALRQDWGRVGVGLRYLLGPGDGIVMLNASNQTGRATGWLSASYRIVF